MWTMAQWQSSKTRAQPKTKAELRQMLTDAVHNTQTSAADGANHSPDTRVDHGELASAS
jgi:hypothetical protein